VNLATISGWVAVAICFFAVAMPIGFRLRHGRRAELADPSVRRHVALGMTALALGAAHPLTALFQLGSPEAIGGGVLGLALGGLAFVVLISHSGLGLKLRDPKLRGRPASRRRHVVTASLLCLSALGHALACRLSAP
jgi:hypothetical protein